jgi:TetR/AcrR family transcriptional regulator, transcriptional repressor for nem operon
VDEIRHAYDETNYTNASIGRKAGIMTVRGELTRTRIIDTARRLFRLQGFARTSIDDICSESGVKRGNLYFYFRSKEEIAQTAIEDALNRQMLFLEHITADETDPLRKIELMIDGIVGYHAARGCSACSFFGNIALELGDTNRPLAEAANHFFELWGNFLRDLFDEAKAAGKLSDEVDTDGLSRLVMSSIEGALVMCKASKDTDSLKKTAEVLKRMTCHVVR